MSASRPLAGVNQRRGRPWHSFWVDSSIAKDNTTRTTTSGPSKAQGSDTHVTSHVTVSARVQCSSESASGDGIVVPIQGVQASPVQARDNVVWLQHLGCWSEQSESTLRGARPNYWREVTINIYPSVLCDIIWVSQSVRLSSSFFVLSTIS